MKLTDAVGQNNEKHQKTNIRMLWYTLNPKMQKASLLKVGEEPC